MHYSPRLFNINNLFILYRDGILVIDITNIEYFSNIVTINGIKNFQDNITITDIDEMNEISFFPM